MSWWTEFSSWPDYRGLLRTGTTLKIHEIVKNFSKHFETVKDIDAYIKNIDENDNQKTMNIYFKASGLEQEGKD